MNNGDGTYTVTFNKAVTVVTGGIGQDDLIFHSNGNGDWWGTDSQAQATADSVTFTEANGDTDCDEVVLIGTNLGGLNPSTGYGPQGQQIAIP